MVRSAAVERVALRAGEVARAPRKEVRLKEGAVAWRVRGGVRKVSMMWVGPLV